MCKLLVFAPINGIRICPVFYFVHFKRRCRLFTGVEQDHIFTFKEIIIREHQFHWRFGEIPESYHVLFSNKQLARCDRSGTAIIKYDDIVFFGNN